MQKEKLITTKELAQNVGQSENYIVRLCENNFIEASFLNDEWLISENAQLPCIKYFYQYDKMDQDNLNILKGHYVVVNLEELSRWVYGVYHDSDIFGFDRVIISKGDFKDEYGNTYQKYILSTEMSSSVAEWTDSLEEIFFQVKDATSYFSKGKFDFVFDTLYQTYKYAQLIYREIPLIEYIVNMRATVLEEKVRAYYGL